MKVSGSADLPLHSGHVPAWMLAVMKRLAHAIVKYMVDARGPEAVLGMLADPLWFQAFNNVIGMDWDSSGSTTIVLAVLKDVSWKEDLGFLVLGGKGRHMLEVPREAVDAAIRLDLDPEAVRVFSKVAARIDSVFLQDGYQLYIHGVAVSRGGRAVVVQQGMNAGSGYARRYHVVEDSLDNPHSGVAGIPGNSILNSLGEDNRRARTVYTEIAVEGPRRFERLLREANRRVEQCMHAGRPGLYKFFNVQDIRLDSDCEVRPYYEPVPPSRSLLENVSRLGSALSVGVPLRVAPGLGPKTLRALALIADIIYGVPTRYDSPVTHPLNPYVYAHAVGGKDGVPYPFDPGTAREAVEFLLEALDKSRLDAMERRRALERLRRRMRLLFGDNNI